MKEEVWVVVTHNGIDFCNEINVKLFRDESRAFAYYHQMAEQDYQDLKDNYGENSVHVQYEEGPVQDYYPEGDYFVGYGTDCYESYRIGEYQNTNWACMVKKVQVE